MARVFRQLGTSLRLFTKGNSKVLGRNFASTTEISLTFVSANKVFYENTAVNQIVVPTFNGVFGILPQHVPLLGVLVPGIVEITNKDGNFQKIFVSSGTLCVNGDSTVQILAEEAHNVEDLDINAAKESQTKAQNELSSAVDEKQKKEAQIALEIANRIVTVLG